MLLINEIVWGLVLICNFFLFIQFRHCVKLVQNLPLNCVGIRAQNYILGLGPWALAEDVGWSKDG